jgi:hypothetical protein
MKLWQKTKWLLWLPCRKKTKKRKRVWGGGWIKFSNSPYSCCGKTVSWWSLLWDVVKLFSPLSKLRHPSLYIHTNTMAICLYPEKRWNYGGGSHTTMRIHYVSSFTLNSQATLALLSREENVWCVWEEVGDEWLWKWMIDSSKNYSTMTRLRNNSHRDDENSFQLLKLYLKLFHLFYTWSQRPGE